MVIDSRTGEPEELGFSPEGSRAIALRGPGEAGFAGLPRRLGRPDAAFVTHLIAMAAQVPQVRLLRRASPQDARAAYTPGLTPVIGSRTRQTV